MVVSGSVTFPPGGVHGQDFSPQLKQLITGLLEKNPNKRLGMLKEGIQGVKRVAWLREIDWPSLESRALEPPFKPDADVNPQMQDLVKIDDEDRELVPPTSRDCPKYGEYFPDF
jgi:serine/threonine protein kinase